MDVKLQGSIKSTLVENVRHWLDCIITGFTPNADPENANRTATVIRLNHISTFLKRTIRFDPDSKQILGDEQANALLGRAYRDGGHWSVPTMNCQRWELSVAATRVLDHRPAKGRFNGSIDIYCRYFMNYLGLWNDSGVLTFQSKVESQLK